MRSDSNSSEVLEGVKNFLLYSIQGVRTNNGTKLPPKVALDKRKEKILEVH